MKFSILTFMFVQFFLMNSPVFAKSEAKAGPCIISILHITEEDKINHLINYVKHLEDAVFIREGSEYPAAKAANHLKNKRKKAGSRIKTAKDFIERLANASTGGEPYKIKFKDGTIITLKDLLLKELEKFEKMEADVKK